MKKIFLAVAMLNFTMCVLAQDEVKEDNKGFKKENLFTGGNVTLSFYTGGTALGISPHFGYSITKWLDAAVSMNFLYTGEKDEFSNKYRQTNFGPGAFIRIFPVQFLFAQAQYEHNFRSLKFLPSNGGSTYKYKDEVNSLLLGAGYASGKSADNNSYYYFSIMFDALKLANSPYVDSHQRLIPVIRAGFNIALFQGNRNRF